MRKFKRYTALFAALVMLMGLVSCGEGETVTPEESTEAVIRLVKEKTGK